MEEINCVFESDLIVCFYLTICVGNSTITDGNSTPTVGNSTITAGNNRKTYAEREQEEQKEMHEQKETHQQKETPEQELCRFLNSIALCALSISPRGRNRDELKSRILEGSVIDFNKSTVPFTEGHKLDLLYKKNLIKDYRSSTGDFPYLITIPPNLIGTLCSILNLISFEQSEVNQENKIYKILISKLFFNDAFPLRANNSTITFSLTYPEEWKSKIDIDCYSYSTFKPGTGICASIPIFLKNGNSDSKKVTRKFFEMQAATSQLSESEVKKISTLINDPVYITYPINSLEENCYIHENDTQFIYHCPFRFNTKCLFVKVDTIRDEKDKKVKMPINKKVDRKSTTTNVKSIYLKYKDYGGIERKMMYKSIENNYNEELTIATPLPMALIKLIIQYIYFSYRQQPVYIITRPTGLGEKFCPLSHDYYRPVYHWQETKVKPQKHKNYTNTEIIESQLERNDNLGVVNFNNEKLIIEFTTISPESKLSFTRMETMEFQEQHEIIGEVDYTIDSFYYSYEDKYKILGKRRVLAPRYVV